VDVHREPVVLGLSLLWLSLLHKSIHRVIVTAPLCFEAKTLATDTEERENQEPEFHERIEYQL
jgi:hypothetical protein